MMLCVHQMIIIRDETFMKHAAFDVQKHPLLFCFDEKAGLGSVGAALGFLLWKLMEKLPDVSKIHKKQKHVTSCEQLNKGALTRV